MFPTEYAIAPDELALALEPRGFEALWLPERTEEKGRSRSSFSLTIYGAAQRPEVIAKYRELAIDRILFLVRPEAATRCC